VSKKLLEVTLLNGVTGTNSGTWVDITSWNRLSVHVKGIETATVQIHGSCEPSKPSDATDGIVLSSLTADGIYSTNAKLKWIKAKVSSYTSGTIYAYAVGDSTIYGV